MDLLLVRVQPTSDGGSISRIKYLKRMGGRGDETALCNISSSQKKGVRICESTSPADSQVSEGGAGDAPDSRAEIPLQALVKTMVQLCPCSLDVHGGKRSTCSPWSTPDWSTWMPEGACERPVLEKAPGRIRGGPKLEQTAPEGLHPMGGIQTGAGKQCEESSH